MDCKTYCEEIKRTWHDEGVSVSEQIEHAELGLLGEFGEFCELIKRRTFLGREVSDKQLVLELGDILYYLLTVARLREVGVNAFEDLWHLEAKPETMSWYSLAVGMARCIVCRTCLFLNTLSANVVVGFGGQELEENIRCSLKWITSMADRLGVSLSELAAENIHKLRIRYPDGFQSGGGVRNKQDVNYNEERS